MAYWHPVTDEVVGKYLECGDPHCGFARIRYEECGAEYLRAGHGIVEIPLSWRALEKLGVSFGVKVPVG